MDKTLGAWCAKVQKKFETNFCRSPSLQSQSSSLSDRTGTAAPGSNVNIELLLDWFQSEVNTLLCEHTGAVFWNNFVWFTPASPEEDDFTDRLTESMLTANKELIRTKQTILMQFESLCEEPLVQAHFLAPFYQRRFLRTLHNLETLWHMIVLPMPLVSIPTTSIEASARAGLWRNFIFQIMAHQFDLLRSDTPSSEDQEDGAADEEVKQPTESFLALIDQLHQLSLVDVCNDVLQALLLDKIQNHVNTRMSGIYSEEDQLSRAKEWVEKDCLAFLARVQCPGIDLDSLPASLNELYLESQESTDSLRTSHDSDLEDQFVFNPGLKRVPSTPHHLLQHGYPTKDPTRTIKRPYGRGSTPFSKRETDELDDSDSDSDISHLPPSQPDFSAAHSKADELVYPTSPMTALQAGRMSPMRPSSPSGRQMPSSPIPLSASLTPIADWMSRNTINTSERKEGRTRALLDWRNQLFKFLFEISSKLRISELFDLIVDYPDSLPAVKDLKTCLDETQQHGQLVVSLRAAIKKRLLLPGATNSDIVAIYISTIRAIREIDPSNVLLGLVTADLREYLRNRQDSVKAIVLLLTEDGGESGISLLNELEESTSILTDANAEIDSDDEETDSKNEWMPVPIIRAPSLPSDYQSSSNPQIRTVGGRNADLISLLVSVHGAKDFTDKYADLLAERLLQVDDFTTESEVKNVELLKLKFGESALLKCEVMLKDMAESKRINTGFNRAQKQEDQDADDQEPDEASLSAAILSTLFWPDTADPISTTLPAELQAQREAFEKYFSSLKSSRTLTWHDTKGTVELDLSFNKVNTNQDANGVEGTGEDAAEGDETQTVTFTVNPLQASIIMAFQESSDLTSKEIAEICKISEEVVRYGISYWIGNGVVREVSEGTYTLSDTLDSAAAAEPVDDAESADEEVEENAEQFIPFIVAMLKNLGTFPLTKIHSRLQNLYDEYTLTLPQLSELLDGMVKSDTIELRNGQFGLIKK